MTFPRDTDYRSRAVRQTIVIVTILVLALANAPQALAQFDEELAGGARGESEWGAEPPEGEDPLRIMGFVGAGAGIRLLRNLDFQQEFLAPAYLDLGAAVYFPGSEVRHGVGLGLTTSLTDDRGVDAFTQWGLTPSYHFLIPLRRVVPELDHDWLHIQGRVGVPFVFSSVSSGVDVSIGGEIAAALHFKFLAGLGFYLEVSGALYGGSDSTVHPVIGLDAGLMFDYEVLQ